MKFTGERLIPDRPELKHLYQEHVIRYMFCSQFVKFKTVLDAGCGTGYGSNLMHESKAKKVVGVDISKEAIDFCQSNYSKNNLEFRIDDCTNLQLNDSLFDVAAAFETIEHLKDQNAFISEIKRVMKNDGIFLVSTPNKLVYPKGNPFHFKEFTGQEFKSFLTNYFSNVVIFNQFYPPSMLISKSGGLKTIKELDILDNSPIIQDSSMFFLAVCSDKPLENISNKLYLYDDFTIIQEEYPILKEQIRLLEQKLKEKKMLLNILEEKKKTKLNKIRFLFNKNKEYLHYVEELENENQNLKNNLFDINTKIENMYKSFTKHNLYTHYEKILDRTYREILQRHPDESALKHYLPLLENNKITEDQLKEILSKSDEAKSLSQAE